MKKKFQSILVVAGCAALGFAAQAADTGKDDPAYTFTREFSDVDELDLSIGTAKCEVLPWDGDSVKVDVTDENLLSCRTEDWEIEISYGGRMGSAGSGSPADTAEAIRVYVPETGLQSVSIEAGAAVVEAEGIQCRELSVEVGAGELTLAGTADREVSAECGTGSVKLILDGAVEDFDYELECGMGSITVENGPAISGRGEERVRNGGGKEMDLECGEGSIDVSFTKVGESDIA